MLVQRAGAVSGVQLVMSIALGAAIAHALHIGVTEPLGGVWRQQQYATDRQAKLAVLASAQVQLAQLVGFWGVGAQETLQ